MMIVESAIKVVVTPIKNKSPVSNPRREIGAPNILENGEFVAPSQLKKLLMSQSPPLPIPCGK